jgi:hypothetical protein
MYFIQNKINNNNILFSNQRKLDENSTLPYSSLHLLPIPLSTPSTLLSTLLLSSFSSSSFPSSFPSSSSLSSCQSWVDNFVIGLNEEEEGKKIIEL